MKSTVLPGYATFTEFTKCINLEIFKQQFITQSGSFKKSALKVSPHRFFFFEVRYTDAFTLSEATKLLQLNEDDFATLAKKHASDQDYWEFNNLLEYAEHTAATRI